ncbi:LVIVD repeat-containing protein [Myxococcus fulvus]|uniref:LVIVD repeat-containing protein n=1 Tax=Myxococcus fulvus TaxID=33 RepID=UPI003B99273B
MTNRWKGGVLWVLLCAGLGSACSRELDDVVKVPVDQGPSHRLEDPGDWSTEPLAACPVLPAGSTSAACGTLESFDLSACSRDSLGAVRGAGIFNLHVIGNDILTNDNSQGTGAVRILEDGRVFQDGVPFPESRLDESTFFVSRGGTLQDGRAYRTSMVGCKAEGATRLTGCFVNCLGGTPAFQGTFELEKVRRREGEAEGSNLELVGEGVVPQGTVADVFVAKGHAYVVSLEDAFKGPGGLYVFDLADRKAPRLVKNVFFPGDSYWNGVWAKDDALYVASAARGLLVFDISDPANPVLVSALPSGGGVNVHTVFVAMDRLYAMAISPAPVTLIFDVKNAREPVLLGRYADPSVNPSVASFPHDATAWGNRLFVNHWRAGLLVLDVSDPANVVKVGEYVSPRATSHTNRWHYVNNRLIVFEGGEDWGAHVRAIDMTDPKDPILVGEYRLTPGVSVHNMELKGNRLYLSHYQHGVRVLDVTRPSEMKEVAYYNTWRATDRARGLMFYDGAIGVRIPDDGYVYVIDTSRGLLIFEEVE